MQLNLVWRFHQLPYGQRLMKPVFGFSTQYKTYQRFYIVKQDVASSCIAFFRKQMINCTRLVASREDSIHFVGFQFPNSNFQSNNNARIKKILSAFVGVLTTFFSVIKVAFAETAVCLRWAFALNVM